MKNENGKNRSSRLKKQTIESKMSTVAVPEQAANHNNDNNADHEDPSKHDQAYAEFQEAINNAAATIEALSARTFHDSSNYKTRQNLGKEDPGKQDFRTIATCIRRLGKHGERAYKSVRPASKRPQTEKSKTSGFNRLVIVQPDLAKFMGLGNWGLTSDVRPDLGVATHKTITRFFSIYIALNGCRNTDTTKKATWKADDRLRKLFEQWWQSEGVNPNAVKYVEIQKVLKHLFKTADKDSHEFRNQDTYRAKLDEETGEFGKALVEIMEKKNRLDELSDLIAKQSQTLATVRIRGTAATMVAGYENELRNSLKEFDEIGRQIREQCRKVEFPVAQNYPVRPVTALDK